MNRRIGHHAGAGGVTLAVLALALVATGDTPADRLSIVSAYLCLAFLGVVLLIGPWQALQKSQPIGNSYLRRDLGIWAAVNGLLHFWLANVLAMNYQYLSVYVDNAPQPPAADLRGALYNGGTIMGYVVAVIFLILLGLSSDRLLRRLGFQRWKRIQRASYLAFALTCLHAFAFQILEWRPRWWVLVVAAVAALVIAAQVYGFIRIRGRGAGQKS